MHSKLIRDCWLTNARFGANVAGNGRCEFWFDSHVGAWREGWTALQLAVLEAVSFPLQDHQKSSPVETGDPKTPQGRFAFNSLVSTFLTLSCQVTLGSVADKNVCTQPAKPRCAGSGLPLLQACACLAFGFLSFCRSGRGGDVDMLRQAGCACDFAQRYRSRSHASPVRAAQA